MLNSKNLNHVGVWLSKYNSPYEKILYHNNLPAINVHLFYYLFYKIMLLMCTDDLLSKLFFGQCNGTFKSPQRSSTFNAQNQVPSSRRFKLMSSCSGVRRTNQRASLPAERRPSKDFIVLKFEREVPLSLLWNPTLNYSQSFPLPAESFAEKSFNRKRKECALWLWEFLCTKTPF